MEIIVTPPDVENALLTFEEASGVCSGSVDFAVDHHGDWWFLEINEQGQFLWLEEFSPQAALLQRFCAFLTADEHVSGSLEDRQQLFPSLAEYDRAHPQREHLDFTHASADSPFKSVER